MALGFKEKRTLQKIVADKQAELAQGGLSFKVKREAQKSMADALEKLNAKIDAGGGSTLLDELIAGKFNELAPIQFIAKLREVVDSINGDIEPIKQPTIGYLEYQEKAGRLAFA